MVDSVRSARTLPRRPCITAKCRAGTHQEEARGGEQERGEENGINTLGNTPFEIITQNHRHKRTCRVPHRRYCGVAEVQPIIRWGHKVSGETDRLSRVGYEGTHRCCRSRRRRRSRRHSPAARSRWWPYPAGQPGAAQSAGVWSARSLWRRPGARHGNA